MKLVTTVVIENCTPRNKFLKNVYVRSKYSFKKFLKCCTVLKMNYYHEFKNANPEL